MRRDASQESTGSSSIPLLELFLFMPVALFSGLWSKTKLNQPMQVAKAETVLRPRSHTKTAVLPG